MKIYFNWLGEWLEINDSNSLINNIAPTIYIKRRLELNKKEDIILFEKYLIIEKDNVKYNIPSSLLVWEEKIN